MSKSNKKRSNYNEEALDAIKKKYGYSLDYIRKCLRGDRTGIMADAANSSDIDHPIPI